MDIASSSEKFLKSKGSIYIFPVATCYDPCDFDEPRVDGWH